MWKKLLARGRRIWGVSLGAGLLGAFVLTLRYALRPSAKPKLPDAISPAIFATRIFYTSRGQVVYHESGLGGPLVFLHGVYVGASSYEWSKVYPHFAASHQVLAVDLLGFGESERPDVPPALREPVSVIREEAERASGIVKNLLSFARKQERRRRPTVIPPLLESTVALLRNELMSSRVECRIEVDPDLSTPVVDANQMQQVFVNLIHNAAQAIAATGRPGTVTVRARRWTDGIAVDVIDDGPGMSEALAAQVFEPFFTTKPEGHGTGLGLSISQGIVTEHGGRITLETADGWGSTFTVHLPAGEGPAPVMTEGTPSAVPGLRILVVDDEPHILHYMRATLESWGHSVSQAADGEEARDRLAGDGFDLVIADLRMPRLGGREFYEELKRTRPAQAEQVVFATGDTVRGDTLAFLKSVGRPYLHKPFSLTELRALLAGVSKAPDE